jgi:cysteine-S-conjugate beta-lyase
VPPDYDRSIETLIASLGPKLAPEATYLAWLDCRSLGLGESPARAFLERGRVAVNDGAWLGSGSRLRAAELRHVPGLLAEAVTRMAAGCG